MSAMILSFAVLVSLLVTSCNGACQVSGCGAICGDTTVNLATVIPQPYKMDDNQDNGGYTFTLDFCNGVSTCSSDNGTAAVCQFTKDGSRNFDLGSIDNPVWAIDTTDGSVTVTFQNGRTHGDGTIRQTIVKFIKQTDINSTTVVYKGDTSNTYTFTITASDLAPAPAPGDISGPIGWALISVFIAAVVTYFIAGSLIMYFVKGARGVEIIPQLAFWKSFPFLIIDGCFFVISPCYKRSSYEKI